MIQSPVFDPSFHSVALQVSEGTKLGQDWQPVLNRLHVKPGHCILATRTTLDQQGCYIHLVLQYPENNIVFLYEEIEVLWGNLKPGECNLLILWVTPL
jgi:hypothetical protein